MNEKQCGYCCLHGGCCCFQTTPQSKCNHSYTAFESVAAYGVDPGAARQDANAPICVQLMARALTAITPV